MVLWAGDLVSTGRRNTRSASSPFRLHIQDRQKIVQAQRADLMSPALAQNLVLAMESSGVRRKHPTHRVGNDEPDSSVTPARRHKIARP